MKAALKLACIFVLGLCLSENVHEIRNLVDAQALLGIQNSAAELGLK